MYEYRSTNASRLLKFRTIIQAQNQKKNKNESQIVVATHHHHYFLERMKKSAKKYTSLTKLLLKDEAEGVYFYIWGTVQLATTKS